MTDPQVHDPGAADSVLFRENGASWYWLLAGPAVGLAMLLIQLSSGVGVQLTAPISFLVLVSGFLALQVKAARIHTSVELTATKLREGTETIPVDEIVAIYPEPPSGYRGYRQGGLLKTNNVLTSRALRRVGIDEADLEAAIKEANAEAAVAAKWQSSRALGELTGVPRGRKAIGLKLTGGRDVQAWAWRHRDLRAVLTQLVEQRPDARPGSDP
jgi:hypothetical protein